MLEEKLRTLPTSSGVYLMKDEHGNIIYVGKAINLKNRVRSYFRAQPKGAVKTIALVRHIADFDYILTDTETEALILECNLIKKHKPKYNISLKDGKTYPYVRITKEPFSHELCYRFQKAIVSTSANVSGEPAAQNYCDISQEILDGVDYVCESRRQEHKPHTPSSIIKLAADGEVKVIRK